MKRTIITIQNCIWVLPIIIAALLLPQQLLAAEQSVWFKDSSLEFSTRNDTITDDKYPTTYAGRGNIDCSNLTLKKRDGIALNLILKIYKESSITGCYIESHAGPVDTNGYINVSGTEYVAEMVKENTLSAASLVFPGSDFFVSNVSTSPSVGTYVWFDHLRSSMKLINMPNGKIFAVIKPTNQIALTDKAGNMLPVMSDNFSISDTGEWLVVDSPGRGMLRINLATMEVLPFYNSFEFGNGIGAALRTAISSDGRFVVVASKNYSTFKLIDLSTCASAPNVITAPVSGCRELDLLSFARSKINDLGTVLQVRFLTDELIKVYASYDVSTASRIGEFVIAAPNTYLTGMDYLGMGDSFSSGEGAHKYELGTDDEDLNMCHLSKVSYPYLIAKRIQANNFHSVACSSARTVNVQGGTGNTKDKSKRDRDNQYDEKPLINPLGEFAPGYRKQVSFISINNPRITTVSVGGNDIGFADKLTSCLKPGTCFPDYEDRLEVFNEIDAKLATFTTTYKKLKDAATKNARVYVIGYPQIGFAGGNCALNVHLNEDELTFAASIITRLNTVIKTAATNAEVNYVDIEDAFTGYRLCENDSDNLAMNGLTAGNDIFEIIGNESYHPNEFGHELMANKILGTTNNLGGVDPIMVPIKLPKIKDDDPALKKARKTGKTVKKRTTLKTTTKAVKKGKKVTIKIDGTDSALPPNTPVDTNIGGVPTGPVDTDENGDIDDEIEVPDDIEPGPQEVEVEGEDVTGQPVVIGGVINVGNDSDDFDGDGITDAQDSCPAFTNAGVDQDQDGIDDACDGRIGRAPAGSTTQGQGTVSAVSSFNQQPPSNGSQATLASGETYPVTAQESKWDPKTLAAETLGAARDSLQEAAEVHPVRFLTILITLLTLLLVLMFKYQRKNKPLFLSAYQEGYPAIPLY